MLGRYKIKWVNKLGKIKLLSESVINKISAGEVVERPKNVIKELVENSIDAKSTKIVVTIKEGGKAYISVLDNGTGIEKEDLYIAFMPHATSKIETDDDLYSVLSLGFRGEALSSISAVSEVTVTSKTSDMVVGNMVTVSGKNFWEEKEVPFNDGTLIEVKNIFQNVPARLKFLKKSSTESALITEFMQKIAFCYPEISFKYVNNGTVILETSGNGNLKEVFYRIYGKEIEKGLVDVYAKYDDVVIDGVICKGDSYRGNRSYGSFFINKRIVKSSILQKAVEDAYKGRLPIGKFPIFALSITVDPSSIDINVHPSKEEVRFSDDDLMYEYMFKAVKNKLDEQVAIPKIVTKDDDKSIKQDNLSYEFESLDIGSLKLNDSENSENTTNTENNINSNANIIETRLGSKVIDTYEDEQAEDLKGLVDVIEDTYKDAKGDYNKHKEKREKKENSANSSNKIQEELYPNKFFNDVVIVGQVFGTYWIIEADNTAYIIDQHSAHEKILYEEFMYSFRNHDVSTQMLLMPISIILTEEESNVLNENIDLFSKFGFEIEIFGKNTYAIRSVPFVFESVNSPAFFMDILENVKNIGKNMDNMTDIYEEKIISMSCKSAVKANDKLSYMDAKALIEKLTKLENPFNCPHGRPTIIELPKTSIEKMFKRIV